VATSKVISFRLGGERLERLQRVARAMNRTPGEAAAAIVEEGLRLREFPGIEFRDTGIGRQAYLRGTRLAVWHLHLIARDFGGDVAAVAEHLGIRPDEVARALVYACAYLTEIEAAIADNEAAAERLAAGLPPGNVVTVP
jgi:hypothetical protein